MPLPIKATGFTLTPTSIYVSALIHRNVSDGQTHVYILIIVPWERQISEEQSFNSTKFSQELRPIKVITLANGWLELTRQISSIRFVSFSGMVSETIDPVMHGQWTMQVKAHLSHLHLNHL